MLTLLTLTFSLLLSQGSSDPCSVPRRFGNLTTVGVTTDGFCHLGNSEGQECCRGWMGLERYGFNRALAPFLGKVRSMEERLRATEAELRADKCEGDLYEDTLKSISELALDWPTLIWNTSTTECRLKLVQTFTCAACQFNSTAEPCRGFCQKSLRGCFYGLYSALESPWKQATSSVATGLRMLSMQGMCKNGWSLGVLNEWRQPLSWIDSSCEGLPETDCYNGEEIGEWESPTHSWSSPRNNPKHLVQQNGLVLEAKDKLESIRKRLAKHWPKVGEPQSDEAWTGSGHSPISPHSISSDETDDEDLIGFEGSGEGSGDLREDNNNHNNNIETIEPPRPPAPPLPPPAATAASLLPIIPLVWGSLFI